MKSESRAKKAEIAQARLLRFFKILGTTRKEKPSLLGQSRSHENKTWREKQQASMIRLAFNTWHSSRNRPTDYCRSM